MSNIDVGNINMSRAYKRFGHGIALVLGIAALSQCGGRGGVGDESQCISGELECACNGGQCLVGLTCVDAICVPAGDSETGIDAGTDSSTSEEETSLDESTGTETESGSETQSNPCTDPETLCEGECVDLTSDASNCGECGNTCKAAPNTGGCVDSACAPVWSECVDSSNPTPCPDVCQSEGLAGCMTAACGRFQLSLAWYTVLNECEAGEFASEGQANVCEGEPGAINDSYYRCCCAQQ
jgi:hypothetical protein